MSFRVRLLTILAVGALASTTVAQAADLSREYEKCIESTVTNTGWGRCSSDEISRQEQWLTVAWKAAAAAMRKVDADSAEFIAKLDKDRPAAQSPYRLLLEGQRAWIKYKDAACQFYGAAEFGREGTVLHFGACKASIIADRVEVLEILTEFLKF